MWHLLECMINNLGMHEDVGVLPIHFHMNMGTYTAVILKVVEEEVLYSLMVFGSKKQVNCTPNVKLSFYFNSKQNTLQILMYCQTNNFERMALASVFGNIVLTFANWCA